MNKKLSTPDPKRKEKLAAFERLLTMMDELRENCPWDKKQTWQSIRHLSIEETYELSDAILENKPEHVKEELGDILLHILFYSRIASEQNLFSVEEVIQGVYDKMYRRHPHVYGDVNVSNEEDVKRNWEQIKLKEKENKGVLAGVPSSLPPIVKALRIQEKAKGVGFEWDNKEDVFNKVLEEIGEFKAETDLEKKTEEFGDVLFSLINYARFEGINPEEALQKTNRKFIKRFNYVEKRANETASLNELSLEEMDVFWNEAKEKGIK
ncbi:MAG: nucleoside triphosphate pyrophosphohydrolase [Cyclobacteriaceae bacterium]